MEEKETKKRKVVKDDIIDCTSEPSTPVKSAAKDSVKTEKVESKKSVRSEKPVNASKPAKKKRAVIDSDSDHAFETEKKKDPEPVVEKKQKVKKQSTKKAKKEAFDVVIEKKEPTPVSKDEESKKEKKGNSGAYRSRWMATPKDPPKHGSKPIPRGKPDCLAGLVFVLTGLNESLTRDEMSELIRSHGG